MGPGKRTAVQVLQREVVRGGPLGRSGTYSLASNTFSSLNFSPENSFLFLSRSGRR